MNPLGALLGGVAAIGVLLAARPLLAPSRPRLIDRIRPVRPLAADSSPLSPLGVLAALAPRVQRNPERLQERLARAGRSVDVVRHLLTQIVYATGGGCAGLLIGAVLGSGALIPVLAALCAVGAVLAHDYLLSRSVRMRSRRMSEQLPAVADLLAFAVAAGQPPLQALDHVSRAVRGDLADEIAHTVGDVRIGVSFHEALRALSRRSGSPDVQRFVDGIIVALDRGTPLAEVLRAQAADARAAGRRNLLELAGKREVAMLVPVVFFVLPIVVVIALYPGLHGLQISVP